MTDATTDLQTATVMGTGKLNPRQQRFVDEYLITLNASDAAVKAGYSPNGAKVQGSRLLSNANVSAAVEARRAVVSEEAGIRHELVIEKLWSVHDASMEKSGNGGFANPAAANKSLELIGKHGGMWQEGHVAGDINIQVNVQPWGKDDG